MWESDLPDVSDHLRQGDLLDLQAIPRRSGITLTPEGLSGTVKVSRGVVLERCCSVENRKTVLIAKVGEMPDLGADHLMVQALRSLDPAAGQPYAYYEHLLAPSGAALPEHEGKLWVIRLLERVSIAVNTHEEFAGYRARRVGRMTIPARAQLRAKLAAHWSRPEDEDATWLADNGYDPMGGATTATPVGGPT